jgi:type I restriction enzyme, S subunit
MKIDTFFEQFDQLTDAPNAVAKLRKLVLQLAVQGKLVEQDTGDESASALLEHVRSVRRQLAEKGRVKTKVQLPAIEADDEPYPIPDTWLWVPLNELTELVYGKLLPTSELLPTGFPVFGANGIIGNYSTYRYEDEMLLISCRGAYSGKPNISPPKCYVTNNSIVCEFFEPKACDIRFYHAVISISPREKLVTGSAQPQVTVANAIKLPVPLPPLVEQKRIVAKVDELMALCGRLEAQLQERDTWHAALARASLARFAEAPTPANLNFLFHDSYTIEPAELRKTILSLAVQGKLVPKDPSDEPAANLIQHIGEKRRLAKARQYPPVGPDEAPYAVPESWVWIRLGNISLGSESGWSPQCESHPRAGDNWGVLKVSAVSWGKFLPEQNKALPPGLNGRPDSEVHPGDFLLSRANTEDLVARSVVVTDTPPRLMMSDKIVRFTFPDLIDKDFINLANSADFARSYYAGNASGTSSSMKNVSREVMRNLPIPLPPLAEQRRIVAKVDQLMSLVDQLEAQLAASRATAASLMNAVVAELTAEA